MEAESAKIWPNQDRAELSGEVRVRRGMERVDADWLGYDRGLNRIDASGDILLEQPGLRITGEEGHLSLDPLRGAITSSQYRLLDIPARGSAERIEIENRERSHYSNIDFTTCRPGHDAWALEAKDLEIDTAEGVGTARDAKLRFQGLPILYTPYLTFPVGDKRKSGFLWPSFGSSGDRGFEISTPYYFNLAPNYDATLTPRVMSKRGLMLGGELRYLTRPQEGKIYAEILPDDRGASSEEPSTRGAVSWKGSGTLAPGLQSNVNVNYVSDDRYLEDFGNTLDLASRRQLERRGDLRYSGGSWDVLGRLQYFQTVDTLITTTQRPYARLPQLLWRWGNLNSVSGPDYSVDTEYVYFDHPDTKKVKGHRLAFRPWVEWPLHRSYGYLTPRVSATVRYYDLDNTRPAQESSPTDAIPSFSLDGKLVFERDISWIGIPALQTLEPRAFYLLTPYEDQSDLPVFDSSQIGFTFGSLFRENRFTGGDRIGDANQLTLALTSRTLAADDATELLRASVGQIIYFADRKVQLPGQPRQDAGTSALALELGSQLSRTWDASGILFWDPDNEEGEIEQGAVALRYNGPGNRAFNIGYRYNLGTETGDTITRVDDTDIALSWPVTNNVNFVGRWKYSWFYDETMDSFAGIEIDRCCWALRLLARRHIRDIDSGPDTSIMLQLELKGLASGGSDIGDFLQKSIIGYEQESLPHAP